MSQCANMMQGGPSAYQLPGLEGQEERVRPKEGSHGANYFGFHLEL